MNPRLLFCVSAVLAGLSSLAAAAETRASNALAREVQSGPTWSSLAAERDIAATRISWSEFVTDADHTLPRRVPALAADSALAGLESSSDPAAAGAAAADLGAAVAPSPATMLVGGLLVAGWVLRQLMQRQPARTRSPSRARG